MKSCFFIGHREASTEVFPALLKAVEQHIVEYGVTEFIVGNYGGFDHMAAKAVIAAKKQHPGIALSMLIPYHPAERPWNRRKGLITLSILRAWRWFLVSLRLSGPIVTWSIMWIISLPTHGTRQATHGSWWNMLRKENYRT